MQVLPDSIFSELKQFFPVCILLLQASTSFDNHFRPDTERLISVFALFILLQPKLSNFLLGLHQSLAHERKLSNRELFQFAVKIDC